MSVMCSLSYTAGKWWWRALRTSCQQVLEADVECSIRVGREDRPLLAGDVLWPAVLVSYRITDLCVGDDSCQHRFRTGQAVVLPAAQQRGRCVGRLTCMFTRMPSPLVPLTIAVTTTRVSLATKFRMHRSFLLSCDCDVACRSNFNALAQAMKRTRLQMYCSSDRGGAMAVVG